MERVGSMYGGEGREEKYIKISNDKTCRKEPPPKPRNRWEDNIKMDP
jgi:hypothetical protein